MILPVFATEFFDLFAHYLVSPFLSREGKSATPLPNLNG